jgi:hypothetical protein
MLRPVALELAGEVAAAPLTSMVSGEPVRTSATTTTFSR